MKIQKMGKYLTTGGNPFIWWVSNKIETRQRRKRAKVGADAIDNLERLHRLKERGAISEDDYQELKEKLKQQI